MVRLSYHIGGALTGLWQKPDDIQPIEPNGIDQAFEWFSEAGFQ